MLLTPTELERLTIYTAAELARKRRAKGLKLNHPEATAIIADEILEGAREGRSVADLIAFGSTILTSDDVMPGVAQLDADAAGGGDLSGRHQAGDGARADPPGHAAGRRKGASCRARSLPPTATSRSTPAGARRAVKALNTGDRPIQVGSHFHFFEVNKALQFEREKAFGMHLDIPAGTAVRFEPGEAKEVTLVEFGGTGEIFGLNSLTNGSTRSPARKEEALRLARERGYKGA